MVYNNSSTRRTAGAQPVPDVDVPLLLEPFRSRIQYNGWKVCQTIGGLKVLCSSESQLAVTLAPIGDPSRKRDKGIRFAMTTGLAIAIETQCAPRDRRTMNARPLDSTLDLSILNWLLEHCESTHSDYCRSKKPSELFTARMVDAQEWRVIPCPPNCDYIALSYVWGGVQSAPGVLEG